MVLKRGESLDFVTFLSPEMNGQMWSDVTCLWGKQQKFGNKNIQIRKNTPEALHSKPEIFQRKGDEPNLESHHFRVKCLRKSSPKEGSLGKSRVKKI